MDFEIINFEFKLTGSLKVSEGLSKIEKEKIVEDLLEKLFLNTDIEVDKFESNIVSEKEDECEDSSCQECSGTGIGNPHVDSRCSYCNGKG